jgi:4-carboxymuconolactone decarboxylase
MHEPDERACFPKPYSQFGAKYPDILRKNEELGVLIHEHGGPLDEKTRFLIKLGISAASNHQTAAVTHAMRAREAGATEEEVMHALLLVIPSCGFPTFMETYRQVVENQPK